MQKLSVHADFCRRLAAMLPGCTQNQCRLHRLQFLLRVGDLSTQARAVRGPVRAPRQLLPGQRLRRRPSDRRQPGVQRAAAVGGWQRRRGRTRGFRGRRGLRAAVARVRRGGWRVRPGRRGAAPVPARVAAARRPTRAAVSQRAVKDSQCVGVLSFALIACFAARG